MLKNRLLLLSLFIGLTSMSVYAQDTLSDLNFPKPPAFRVGISELPEQKYVQPETATIKSIIAEQTKAQESADLIYADLSIKRIFMEKR